MITQEMLKEHFYYDELTGNLICIKKTSRYSSVKIGDVLGNINSKGYSRATLNKKTYKTHRLIWLYVYGYLPEKEIDHINRIKHDNRISNLRLATRSENMRNNPKNIKNTSGYKGVSWDKYNNCWQCSTKVNGKTIRKSCFKTPQDAYMAYKDLALKYHGEFVNIN